jgi:RNA polymerase sigma-70 factor (ECF subfamily)
VLYRSSRDRLAGQLLALTGDRGEAIDIVQEAFARAWAKWDRISRYEDPEVWVRRVAHNLAIGRWRRARRVVLRSELPQVSSEFSSDHLEVIDALRTLPPPQRQAIVLRYLVGLSVAEIATEMRSREGTVKSWLSRGRSRMAEALNLVEERQR